MSVNELIYQIRNSFVEDCEDLDENVQMQFHLYKDGICVVIGDKQVEIDLYSVKQLLEIMNMKYGGL